MSQEPGPFSGRRKRETLGNVSHNVSAIPMPSSAMKRSNSSSNLQQPFTQHARSTSGSRMSLAPGRPSQPVLQRSSSGSNIAEMGFQSVQRHSTSNMLGSAPGRKSFAPLSASTPAHAFQGQHQPDASIARRSSISVYSARNSSSGPMSGGHQSFFQTAPAPAGVPTDPRRLKDARTRAQMSQELGDYLSQNNFEMETHHSLSPNWTTSPMQKDFNHLFQWLYHRIDPTYHFQKTIENEVPPLLKQMRYPFEKNIMKSQIAAVGGGNWPTFLGLLHWMMQLARMMEAFSSGAYDDACAEVGIDVSGDRIIFEFLSNAYRDWLSMDDDADESEGDKAIQPHIDAMAARFDDANAHHLDQVKMLEAEHTRLQDQIAELGKSGPRLAKLEDQIKILEEDKKKFEEYNQNMEAKVEKYNNRMQLLENEIAKVEKELEESEQEKRKLQEEVDRQGITIMDIDRMSAERERLQRGVEATNARLEESKRKVAEKETDAAQKLDELERLVEKYNSLGYQIGIIPSTALNAKGREYELVLTVNDGPGFRSSQMGSSQDSEPDRLLADSGNGYQPHHILNLDLKGAVRSNIIALKKEISDRRNEALEKDLQNNDMLDQIKEAIDDKQAEIEGLSHKVRAAEEEFEKTREITTEQKMKSDAQVEKMEKELAKMRADLSENVQLMEQREKTTEIEYERLTHRAAALREELHTEMERMLDDVVRFKLHVQDSLEKYEGFVAEEVERELEEQMKKEDGAMEE